MKHLLDVVFERDRLADLDAAARRLELRRLVAEQGDDAVAALPALADHIDGYGAIARLMDDPDVTDILINGPTEVWIERNGALEPTGMRFGTRDELHHLIQRLLGDAGGCADSARPIADARLPDGSRMHVVMPPIAPRGPLVSMRRFRRSGLSLDDMQQMGSITEAQRDRLLAAVRERRTLAISGATGSGKTTLLNALLSLVGADERVLLIEETPELAPGCPHVVSLVTRPPNVEGAGAIDLASLVRAALRMRPDRIVVGEMRGAEALVALTAMSTGHRGSMVTVHAHSAADAVDRITELALGAGDGRRDEWIAARVRRALDLVVHLSRGDNGRRRVDEIRALP